MVIFWVMLPVPGTVDEGYSMRDDRLGIHRECRRFFFLLSTAGAHLGNVVSIR